MKNQMKKQTGITLIALVITIIVLLILVGVSIATLTGENGILTKGSDAKLATEQAEILEKLRMEIYENRLDIESNVTEIQFLKNKEIITKEVSQERETVGKLGKYASIHHELSIAKTEVDSGSDTCYIIDVSKVIQNPTTGKGSWEKGDVYYILKGDLYYKDKDMQSKKQGEVFKITEPTLSKRVFYIDEVEIEYKENMTWTEEEFPNILSVLMEDEVVGSGLWNIMSNNEGVYLYGVGNIPAYILLNGNKVQEGEKIVEGAHYISS